MSYTDSTVKKFKTLFFKNTLVTKYNTYGNDVRLNDIYYFDTKSGHLGFYINGSNPYFTDKKLEDFDTFNLFARHEKINRIADEDFFPFTIKAITLCFGPENNELVGFLLSETAEKSISVVLQYDSAKLKYVKGLLEFKREIKTNLAHIHKEDFTFIHIN